MMDKYHDCSFDDQIEMLMNDLYKNSIDYYLFDLTNNLYYDDDEILMKYVMNDNDDYHYYKNRNNE
jgi:hypothetical protein